MKYQDISGYIIIVISLFYFQSYSSESLVVSKPIDTSSLKSPETFLFDYFDVSPLWDTLPRDVQYMIVGQLTDMLVGKIELGKGYRYTQALPDKEKETIHDSVLNIGKSFVNVVKPGCFEELPPHISGTMKDLVFTEDDEHIIGVTRSMYFVVSLGSDNSASHAPARFVDFLDREGLPRQIYDEDRSHDVRFNSAAPWNGVLYEQDSSIESIYRKPLKFTEGFPLVFYSELCRTQGKPLWQKSGDLRFLVEAYPIHSIKHTEDHTMIVGVGSEELPFVSKDDELIAAYQQGAMTNEIPDDDLRYFSISNDPTIQNSSTLFCEFTPLLSPDHEHYEAIADYKINKKGREYRSALSPNYQYLLLKINDHEVPEPDEIITWKVKDRLRYYVTNNFHVWDVASGSCLQRFSVKGDVTYATISSDGRFTLILCYCYCGDIEKKKNDSMSIILLYHIESNRVVGYQRRGSEKAAFSPSGKFFVTSDENTGYSSETNPTIANTLHVWMLDQFINLDDLYKGRLSIEHALFILFLRILHHEGNNLHSSLSCVAQQSNRDEVELLLYFKRLYHNVPKPVQSYLIKLMGS